MKTIAELADKIRQLTSEAESIAAKCEAENREPNAQEKRRLDEILDKQLPEARIDYQRSEKLQATKAASLANFCIGREHGEAGEGFASSAPRWTTANGTPVRVVNRGERFARGQSPIGMGDILRAKISGNHRMLAEVRDALQSDIDTSGGFLVPHTVSESVIDLARANSALIQAGVPVVEMSSDTMTMARVSTDPVFSTKSQGSALQESALAFDAVTFSARTIGCYVRLSRELVEDAPNASRLVEEVLGRALAAEIDRQGVSGDANAEETGLLIYSGVGETGSVGAIDWLDVHSAAVAVRGNNFEPTGFICSPVTAGDLDGIETGDGTTAARGWLGAPPSLLNVPRYVTTNCPNSGLIVGDFQRGAAFGIRTSAIVEVTNVGGDSFKNHELWVKCVWRGCFRLLQPGAFARLSGIST